MDLDKAKAWLKGVAEGGTAYEDPQGCKTEEAEDIIEALVGEVERLRKAAREVIDAYERAAKERWDECAWGEFAGVGPLESALSSPLPPPPMVSP